MSKREKTKQAVTYKRILTKKNIIVASVVLVALFGVSIFTFTKGYPQYYYYYLKCGGKQPVAIYYWSPYDKQYSLPSNESYPEPSNFFIKYVCTEKEAIDIGAKFSPKKDDIEAKY